jgi:hypothetical protein
MTAYPPAPVAPGARAKVAFGAILRIRGSPEYRQVSADSGHSPGQRRTAQLDPKPTFPRRARHAVEEAAKCELTLCEAIVFLCEREVSRRN